MKIYPIAITACNWQPFIEMATEFTGESPTRGIDKSYLKISDPSAFLACMDMNNDPMNALRKETMLWEHFTVTFGALLTAKELAKLRAETALIYYSKRCEEGELILGSGSIRDWKLSYRLAPESEFISGCVNLLRSTGFKEVFI